MRTSKVVSRLTWVKHKVVYRHADGNLHILMVGATEACTIEKRMTSVGKHSEMADRLQALQEGKNIHFAFVHEHKGRQTIITFGEAGVKEVYSDDALKSPTGWEISGWQTWGRWAFAASSAAARVSYFGCGEQP